MAIVRLDALRSLAYTGISGSYATVGTPLTRNWSIVKITNNTDGDMIFSADGTTDNLFVPAFGFTLYDCSTNAPPPYQSDAFVFQLGTQWYVKQSTAPSKGAVYIEGVYARSM
jgi:hypothetical protein